MFGFYQQREEEFYCKSTNNNSYPPHLHKQVEIIYVTKGKLQCSIDEQEETLSPGDLSICFPNLVHWTKTIEESEAILLIFHIEFAGPFSYELSNLYPHTPFIKSHQLSLEAKTSIEAIAKAYTTNEDIRIAKGFIYILLGRLFKLLSFSNESKPLKQDSCYQLLQYIDSHFTQDMSLESLSTALNMNKYYISHIFSDKIKSTFTDYVNRCRVEYAKNLLSTTNISITQIAYDSGFNSDRTFYRSFKNLYGITPLEYRKRKPT